GLTILTKGAEVRLPHVKACATTKEIGPVDVVLIALKATAKHEAARLAPPLIGPATMLLTLQNGLGNEEFLAARWGARRVGGALCFVCLNRTGPGLIEHYDHGSFAVGDFHREPQPRTRAIAHAFRRAGIESRVVENLL